MKFPDFPNASTLFWHLPRVLRRHRLISAWITFTGQSPIQLVPIIGDVWGYADLREVFLRLIVIDGSLESDFFSLARAIFPQSGTFFDVGANFGLMTVGMAGAVAPSGHYHLFEPNAELTPIIARSLARLNSVNARINTAAVSDCTENVFYCCPHDLRSRPGDTQTLRLADGNATIPVVEVDVLSPPEETDLLAVHRSHLDG